MYHVSATGLTILIIYLISYAFCKTGIYTLQFHRKLWNTLLALVFIITAGAGIFLALQITYKWNIPQIKEFLKWHVETGIAMAFTGIFHFAWHLPYYFKKSANPELFEKIKEATKVLKQENYFNAGINLFIIGFVSSSAQFLLLREMLNISGGYELIAGIYLGIWLISSAAGSFLAGKSGTSDPGRLNLLFAITLLLTPAVLVLFSNLILVPGETPSVLKSLFFIIAVLSPFCIVSGFIFVKITNIALTQSGTKPGRSFASETTGGIIAGIIVSILIAGGTGTYKLYFLIALLYSAFVLLAFLIQSKAHKLIYKLTFAAVIVFIVATEPDVIFRQALMKGLNITENRDTPYGNLAIGEYNGERSIFYNQRLLFYTNDVIEREEDIHYAMLQHKNPQKVMLLSGSLLPHLHEILKYPVKELLFVERDPVLAQIQIPDSLKDKVSISNADAYSFIKKSDWTGDIIIMLIPPPSTLLLNRYYTQEFIQQIHNKLDKGGVFICSTGPGDNYLNDESLRLNSSVFNTLNSVFKNVVIVPGNKTYIAASDNELSLDFCALAEQKKIKNLYVNSDYLEDDIMERRSAEIMNQIDRSEKLNTSSFPLAYNYFQQYHLSRTSGEKIPVIILLTALFALPGIAAARKNITMYLSAAALAGFEIIALLTLQFTAGNMYQMTGLVLSGLMAGLAVGSARDYKLLQKISFRYRALVLAGFYLLTGLFYSYLAAVSVKFIAVSLIILLSFVPSFITGSIFRWLSSDSANEVSNVYTSDLTGSALGFMIVTVFAIPFLGIASTVIFLGILVFAGFLFGAITNKQ